MEVIGKEPLCKMSDSDVYLVDGNWANPNCITVHGKPVHPDEVREENSNDARAKRAEFVEFHSYRRRQGK